MAALDCLTKNPRTRSECLVSAQIGFLYNYLAKVGVWSKKGEKKRFWQEVLCLMAHHTCVGV